MSLIAYSTYRRDAFLGAISTLNMETISTRSHRSWISDVDVSAKSLLKKPWLITERQFISALEGIYFDKAYS